MRRIDKEIKDLKVIESILEKAIICRIGLCDGNMPYIVPMNFGYKNKTIYLHSAKDGKKMEILKRNNNVCFEVDVEAKLKTAGIACKFGTKYKSVVCFGKAHFIESAEEKKKAFDVIMSKYSSKKTYDYQKEELEKVIVIKIDILSVTGKESK
jgi:hypothetical protein